MVFRDLKARSKIQIKHLNVKMKLEFPGISNN